MAIIRGSKKEKPHKVAARIVRGPRVSSEFANEMQVFINGLKERRFLQIVEAVKVGKDKKGPRLQLPASKLMGIGQNSERALQEAFGWYWEPLLHDLAFFEEMRDCVSIVDGSVQKLVTLAMDGMRLQVQGRDEAKNDLNKMLFRDQNVNFREVVRRSMIDIFSLGNCYAKPEYIRDEKGRLALEVIRPIRANAVRKLRNDKLATEGYVQLLHRPSEFILGGTPHIPTVYPVDEIAYGWMRTFGWYAYGRPLMSSLPFVLRLKLQMERDLAEMLHQHLPRIDVVFTPDEQMNQDQVDEALADIQGQLAKLLPTDQWAHTPDTTFEYKGPQGHALDFANPQKHIEDQHFYVLPLAQSIMGLDSRGNPYDSQQRWTIATKIAAELRGAAEMMFSPMLDKIAEDWGIESIELGWSDLDPENTQNLAEADEYTTNNAVLKRDAGFIDQDTAAKHATQNHADGPVKKAAAPGQLPPPVDPNKPDTPASKPKNNTSKTRKTGPKTDGTKVPDRDKRPKGKRHDQMLSWAFDELEAL